jgi:hypothetical protein
MNDAGLPGEGVRHQSEPTIVERGVQRAATAARMLRSQNWQAAPCRGLGRDESVPALTAAQP